MTHKSFLSIVSRTTLLVLLFLLATPTAIVAQNSNTKRYSNETVGRTPADTIVVQQPKVPLHSEAKTLPTWTPLNSTPFTVANIDGNTVNLADTLLSGKSVLIHYFFTWNSWDWLVYQTGSPRAIRNQLGDSIYVLMVAIGPGVSSTDIHGTSSDSRGDWTTAGIPIIMDNNSVCDDIIAGGIYACPFIVFISPTGYYTELYGYNWGFDPYTDTTIAVGRMRTLLNTYPEPNTIPTVTISGPDITIIGDSVTFTANIISVDSITNIAWTFAGGTPSSANTATASTVWATAGTYTITLNVTNTSGTATTTKTITVNDWSNWGDTIDYCGDSAYSSSIGYSGSGEISWGIRIPEEYMHGRNYLSDVLVYIPNAGNYELLVYQGGTGSPQTLVYSHTYHFVATDNWQSCPIYATLSLDTTQNMWITFHCNNVAYPAAYTSFCGDYNSSLIFYSNQWYRLQDIASDYNPTWMIKAITSSTPPPPPPPQLFISGPTTLLPNQSATFTATHSPATITWQLPGATPSTATGDSVTATWATPGNYNVIATASTTTNTVSDTLQVQVLFCDTITTFPYTMGFESNDSIDCWAFIDADGDGYGWCHNSVAGIASAHTGVGSVMSASYINNVGTLHPNNWMILPVMAVPSNHIVNFSWYEKAQSSGYLDHYGIYISTTGNNINNFTLVQDYTCATNWVQRSLDLSAYAGQNIRIAFRHYNSDDEHWVVIDDISLTTVPLYTITYTCTGTGSGQVRLSSSSSNLCGSSENIADNSVVYYRFIPDDSSYLAHIYVNNVDRLSGAYGSTYNLSISISGNTTVNAVFTARTYHNVTFACTGTGSGWVQRSSSYRNLCGRTDRVADSSWVYYDFVPSSHSYLTHLYVDNVDRIDDVYTHVEDNDTTHTLGIPVYGPTTINAVFAARAYQITAISADSSMGMVTGGGSYFYGSEATLTAIPMPHYHFTYWEVNHGGWTDTTHTNPLYIEVWTDLTFVAHFAPDIYTISVQPNNVVYGTVTGGGTFTYLDPVTLSATAYSGYRFLMWSNGRAYNPYNFPATEDLALTAIFVDENDPTQYFAIVVDVNDAAMGTASGGGAYQLGDIATLTATAYNDYHFMQWQDGNTSNPRQVTVMGDATYTAYFAQSQGQTFTLTTQVNNNTMGYVTGGGEYNAGSTATLTAHAYSGYRFERWQDGITDNPRQVSVVADTTFTAYFATGEGIDAIDGLTLTLYPNPASNEVSIGLSGLDGHVRLTVLDASGRQVLARDLECQGDCTTLLPLSHLSQGVYFVRVVNAESLATVRKLIVK